MAIITNSVTGDTVDGENTFDTTVGVVVMTPEEIKGNQVGVFVSKLFPSANISDKPKEYKVSYDTKFIKNSKVKKIGQGGKITLANYIKLYVSFPSGLAMPDFQVGDTVFVNIVDQDIKTMYCTESPVKQQGKKEGERVRMESPANKEGSGDNMEVGKDNAYSVEIDSRKGNQRIALETTKNNGEKAAIRISIDAKNGLFYVSAGREEVFKYSFEDDEWLIKTNAGATVSLKEKVFEINADEININAESKINIKTKQMKTESDKITEKANNVKLNYSDLTQEGKNAKFKIDQEKHEGLAIRFKHTIGFQVESALSAFNGLIMAANLTFGSGPPSIDVPISVPDNTMKVDQGNMDMGSSNVTVKTGQMEMGAGSMPLAKANPIGSALNKLAAYYDLLQVVGQAYLVKAYGVSAMVNSDVSQISSMNVKGQ